MESTTISATDMMATMNSSLNMTGEDGPRVHPHPITIFQAIFIAIEVLLMVVIIGGNGLVIIAIWRSEQLRTVTNFFVANLAIADFCVGLFLIMHICMFIQRSILENLHVCVLRYASLNTTMSASLLCLLAITYDRHKAIFRPLHYEQEMTPRWVRVIIAGVWIIPFIFSMTIPFLWHNQWPNPAHKHCDFVIVMKEEYIKYIMVPSFMIVCVVMVTMYARIFHLANKVAKETVRTEPIANVNNAKKERSFKKDYKLAKTGAIVIGLFFFSWLPFIAIVTIQVYGNWINNGLLNNFRTFGSFLAILNSAFNPIIYAFRFPSFKVEFMKILRLKVNRVDYVDSTSDYVR